MKINIEEYISFATNKIYAAHNLICSIFQVYEETELEQSLV